MPGRSILSLGFLASLLMIGARAEAHAIGGQDAAFVAAVTGPAPFPFAYLGARHMVTGYDHILFLLGVIFFLRGPRDIVLYVSLFSLGHSLTLIAGVLLHTGVNPYLVDAVIGLSVVYKSFDNLDGFETLLKRRPDPRIAIFAFGLCHGLGLATKLEQLRPSANGLLVNLLSFSIGVELGQVAVLAVILGSIISWRHARTFPKQAVIANLLLFIAGLILAGEQFAAYLLTGNA